MLGQPVFRCFKLTAVIFIHRFQRIWSQAQVVRLPLSLNNSESLTATGAFHFSSWSGRWRYLRGNHRKPARNKIVRSTPPPVPLPPTITSTICVSCQKKTYVNWRFYQRSKPHLSADIHGNVTEVFMGSFQFSWYVRKRRATAYQGQQCQPDISIQNQNGMISGTNVRDVTVTCNKYIQHWRQISTDNAGTGLADAEWRSATFCAWKFQFSTTLTNGSELSLTIGTPPVSRLPRFKME